MESLLCQKGAEYEILLVDDGSTDDSGELCDSYAKQYPDIVRVIHKENEGLLLTRRRGLREAKGDWLINVDSDDYISPVLLKNVVNAIEQYHPDMVMYNFDYFTDAGEVSESRLTIPDHSVFEDEGKQQVYAKRLLSNDINSMCMKALKREIVDIDADYSDCGIRNMCEDAVQVLPLFTAAQKIIYLAEPLYHYRKGHSSITGGRTYENWTASKNCFMITERYLDIWQVSDELRNRYYTQMTELLSNFLRWLFSQQEKNIPRSISEIVNTIRINPAFLRCMEHYNRRYAQTLYLKVCVPILMNYTKRGNVKGLKRYFSIEKKLLSH
jgi:glycosyltransferase involved in cell wall biosynthesis